MKTLSQSLSIDVRIIYRRGDTLAYLRPMTPTGRHWLIDHVGGRTLNTSFLATAPQQLLTLSSP